MLPDRSKLDNVVQLHRPRPVCAQRVGGEAQAHRLAVTYLEWAEEHMRELSGVALPLAAVRSALEDLRGEFGGAA